MIRIQRISKLRDCGIFRDFSWPKDLQDFGRYNLIYGWNGTGKTTLSRILRCLEQKKVPIGQVQVILNGREVAGDQFPNEKIPIRVFNREFISENVFPVSGGDLPPIYVFGTESVTKQKKVERLKVELAQAQSNLETARFTKQRAEKDFDQFCINNAKNIKDFLRSSEPNRYNNYDKSELKSDANKILQSADRSIYRLNYHDRDTLHSLLITGHKKKIEEIRYSLPSLSEIASKISKLLATTVVSATIEALKDDADLADWISQGLALHHDRKSARCMFCDQPMPKERLAKLEAHFNTQYEQFISNLDQEIDELQSINKALDELRLPDEDKLYNDLTIEYQTAKENLINATNKVKEFINISMQILKEKKHRAFERIEKKVDAFSLDSEAVQKLNAVIRKHNKECDEFQIRASDARKRLAEDMIAEDLQEYVSKKDAAEKASTEVQVAINEIEKLKDEIRNLEAEIREHRRPAEELNEDLQKYLGHDELQLEVKDTGYTIKRGDLSAQALSEGEMTAIALLYFLKSLEDMHFKIPNGIVVLDDPVSSLDTNALYLAFEFIRDRTKDAGQLIFLTHNFTFFRLVKKWFDFLKQQKNDEIMFYMLDCLRVNGERYSSISELDPLLKKYESEYHYLFSCIYQAANDQIQIPLDQNYILPNIARRFLESFLAFRQPSQSGHLWKSMQDVCFDNVKKNRIYRFLNIYSHSDSIGEPEHDISILRETKPVLKDLLEFIESQDKAHYDEMVKLVKQSSTDKDKG